MQILIAILIVILAGGGAAAAAENAKPGDALYGFKVNVTEEVRSALAFSAQAKAGWESELAGRRLDDAEEVTANATLDADTRAQLEENFKRHADSVEARIKDLEDVDLNAAADLSANFETSLDAHAKILAMLAAKADGAEKTEVEAMERDVADEQKQASDLRAEVEEKVSAEANADVQAAAEGKMKAAENKIAEVRKFLGDMKVSLGAAATAQAEARLAVADQTLADGKAKLDAKAYGDAFKLFSAALRIAQEAQMLATARLDMRLDLDLDGAGAVDQKTEGSVQGEQNAEVKTGGSGAGINANANVNVNVHVNAPGL